MFYKLFRYVDNAWWYWMTYENPITLANAANELGRFGFKTRVEVVKDEVE